METLADAWRLSYRPANLRDASATTLRLWDIALRHFDRFVGRPATLTDLNDAALREFSDWRIRSGVQAATANRDLASLLALWRWLHRLNLVEKWPTVQLLREPRRIPIAWTRDEFTRLLTAARGATGCVGDTPARVWWPAVLLTCFDTAERIGAVMCTRWCDYSPPWIIFPAETRKGSAADSAVRIAEDTAAAIAMLPRLGPQVFHWPYEKNYLWRRYGALLQRAGLPNDRRRKFHCIRRTTASHAAAAGGDPTALLRHASRQHTMCYLDPRINTPPQAVDILWRP